MDPLTLLRKCNEQAFKFIELIGPDQWGAQTLTKWNAKDLLNHSLVLNYLTPELLNGSGTELFTKFESNFIGDQSPLDAWRKGTNLALDALASQNALEKNVHLPFGDISASAFTNILASENLFHSWDLAHATVQEDNIDKSLVDYFYSFYESQQQLVRESGLYGQKLEVPENSDLQTKLLALLGRRRH